jgi:hypothetical protein
MREEVDPEYFLDVHDRHWSGGLGQPAGIYWLDGRSVMAAHASRAEEWLLERGAILVGTLLFERDPLESSHPGRPIERIPAAGLARTVHHACHGN